MPSYLVQEEDGTSRILLEDGGGFLLLEESIPDLLPGECGLLLGDGSGLLELGDGSGLLLLEQCPVVVTGAGDPFAYSAELQRRLRWEAIERDDEDLILILATLA